MRYRIREILQEKGMTFADLSRKMNMRESYLRRIADDKVAVSNYRLAEIACALGVQHSDLFDDDLARNYRWKLILMELPPEVEIGASDKDIQGNWKTTAFGTNHSLTFHNGEYAYIRTRVKKKEIYYVEYGTYKIDGENITFTPLEGESSVGGNGQCKCHWENPEKTRLHLWPAGSYEKAE